MESQEGKNKGWEGSAGAKEREKEYLYWLCKLALLGAVSIERATQNRDPQ